MFSELELKHSLYDIQQDKLDFFKFLASHFFQENTTILKSTTIHKKIDNYAIVFNIWLFLQENRENIFFINDKMMPYASNFYTFEQMRRNIALKDHIKSTEYTEEYTFILAYFLSEELIKWVFHSLQIHEETIGIMELNKDRDYFKLASDEDLTYDKKHILYEQQKHVTKTLASNISASDDFNHAIKIGIKHATHYWQEMEIQNKQGLHTH